MAWFRCGGGGTKLEPTVYTKPNGAYLTGIWNVKNINKITVTASAFAQYRTLYVCGGDNANFDSAYGNTLNGTVLLHITTAGTYEIDVSGYDYVAFEFWQTETELNRRYTAYGSVVVEGGQLVKAG